MFVNRQSKRHDSAGIGREALHKALRQDSAPRFDTINRVVNASGSKLTVKNA